MRERVEEQPKTLGLFFGGGGGSAFDFRRTWGHQASSSLNKLGFIKSNNFWGGGGGCGGRWGLEMAWTLERPKPTRVGMAQTGTGHCTSERLHR